jgi:hypothetical protein
MVAQKKKKTSDGELWKTIPFEEQVFIDIAIDKGNKAEATNRCMCFGKGFTLSTAKSIVSWREKMMPGLVKNKKV